MNLDPRPRLIAAAHQFYQFGWMLGTAGNLSARMPDNSFWITVSGKDKGQLTPNDFVRVTLDGKIVELPAPESRPSAETSIHQAIYDLFPQTQACYHVHSVEANLVANFTSGESVALPPLEMLKGLGIWEENPSVSLPIFENHLEVSKIAKEIRDRFSSSPSTVPALLIRNHGVTVWANSTKTAHNYIEIIEYLFRYIVAARQLGMEI